MVAFVVSLALALVPHAGAAGHLPVRGVVVAGGSFAGVRIGDSESKVKALWGPNPSACKYCTDLTWLYEYSFGEPLGAAVRFENGKAVAIFTLGSPTGWKSDKDLEMGDPIGDVYDVYKSTTTTRCIGFDAVSVRIGKLITAFYSSAGVIYGFAIVVPGMTVCQ